MPHLNEINNKAMIYRSNSETRASEKIKNAGKLTLTDCPKVRSPYSDDRCKVPALREGVNIHSKNCVSKESNCQYCGKSVALLNLNEHYETCEYIPSRPVIPQVAMASHDATEFPGKAMRCPFVFGRCTVKKDKSSPDDRPNSGVGGYIPSLPDNDLNDKVKLDPKLKEP
jgi:hypothetical protein